VSRRAHDAENPGATRPITRFLGARARERPDLHGRDDGFHRVIGRRWGGYIVFEGEEILMWAALKKAVAGVTKSSGIEIPGLPVDLGAVGDAAASAAQGVTEAAGEHEPLEVAA
jgi:hypothetical protein